MPKILPFPGAPQTAPTDVNATIAGNHGKSSKGGRRYLLPTEIDQLLKVAKKGRYGARDALLIKMCFCHGLRAGEAVNLMWSQFDLDEGRFFVERLKHGVPSTHYLSGEEIRHLRRQKRQDPAAAFVFQSERGGPLTTAAFRILLSRLGKKAQLSLAPHPHMLRHSCGYVLANQGMDTRALQHFLGHRAIRHTVRYTELSAERFKGVDLGKCLKH